MWSSVPHLSLKKNRVKNSLSAPHFLWRQLWLHAQRVYGYVSTRLPK